METFNKQALIADFLSWSGGFSPESDQEIFVYLEYACPKDIDTDLAREVLVEWMEKEELNSINSVLVDFNFEA